MGSPTLSAAPAQAGATAIEIRDANLWYAGKQALHAVSLDIPRHQVTSVI